MEYYNVVANYTGRLTLMWSGKFNNNSLTSQGKSGNFYYQTEWEPWWRNRAQFTEQMHHQPFPSL